eukprot:ANDGO_02512.mRNA.1 hypothetical protein
MNRERDFGNMDRQGSDVPFTQERVQTARQTQDWSMSHSQSQHDWKNEFGNVLGDICSMGHIEDGHMRRPLHHASMM